jgi:cystathionine beta-lyase/cystathionine gamma-synthase
MSDHHHDGYSTRAIHVGSEPDPVTGALAPTLNVSTTFKFKGIDETTVSSVGESLADV